MKPYISIIIPVYKVELYIRECLDSIINWQFANWEAILVDDGSPDNSGIICDEYAAKDIRIKVIHKYNEGVSVARNVGLDIAQGEWCWFVDSDDLININTPVNESLYKDKDIIIFNVKTFNEGEIIQYSNETKTHDVCNDINTFYLKWISYTHQSHWYNRKYWEKNGKYHIRFTKGIKLGEDLEFMRKCELLSENPLKVNCTNYFYRIRIGSAYHNSGIKKQIINDTFRILNHLYDFIVQYKIEPSKGFLKRFTNLAICIPAYAIKCDLWERNMQKDFKLIVKKYEHIGMNLTSSSYIWIATKIPYLLKLASKIK